MLRRLSVENYALIDKLEMELGPHLNIITGETGAGKSILLGALGLLLGAKNDGQAMKDATRNCTVEGTFDLAGSSLEAFFAENDLDYAPETTLTRMITPAGKSRAFVNDVPVQLAQLRELGARLLDIHSQHQNLILSSEEFRTSALDTVAANGELLAQYTAQYARLTELRRRLTALFTVRGPLSPDLYGDHRLQLLSIQLPRCAGPGIEDLAQIIAESHGPALCGLHSHRCHRAAIPPGPLVRIGVQRRHPLRRQGGADHLADQGTVALTGGAGHVGGDGDIMPLRHHFRPFPPFFAVSYRS